MCVGIEALLTFPSQLLCHEMPDLSGAFGNRELQNKIQRKVVLKDLPDPIV